MALHNMSLARRKAINTYRQSSVETASPGELILLLYNEAIRSMNEAITLIEKGDVGGANSRILKAQDIMAELRLSLNPTLGGDIAKGLDSVYQFVYLSLVSANLKKEPEKLKSALSVMIELREGWEEAIRKYE